MITTLIEGNVVADPVLRESNDGSSFATFSVAVNRGPKDDDGKSANTDFFSIAAFNSEKVPLADNVIASFSKGDRVILFVRVTKTKRNGLTNSEGQEVTIEVDRYRMLNGGHSVMFATTEATRNEFRSAASGNDGSEWDEEEAPAPKKAPAKKPPAKKAPAKGQFVPVDSNDDF